MGTLRFFEEVVSFKIRRTFGFADYRCPANSLMESFFCLRMSDRYSLYVPAGSFLAFANRLPLPLSHDAHRNMAIETAIILAKIIGCFKFDFNVFILYHFVLFSAKLYIIFDTSHPKNRILCIF